MKKKVTSISSPDELETHLQSTSAPTWVILGLVAALLVSFFACSYFARVPVHLRGDADLHGGEASLHIEDKERNKLALGQKVVISGKEGTITSLEEEWPIASSFDLQDGEYVYFVVIKEARPFDFLANK